MGHSFAVSSVSLFVHLFILLANQLVKGIRFIGEKSKPVGKIFHSIVATFTQKGQWVLTALNDKGQVVITLIREKRNKRK